MEDRQGKCKDNTSTPGHTADSGPTTPDDRRLPSAAAANQRLVQLTSACSRALSLMELNRVDEALAASEQALSLHPSSAEALSCHGSACYLKGLRSRCPRERCVHLGRAAESFCAAHDEDPTVVDAQLYLKTPMGRCYHALRMQTPGWAEMGEPARQCAIDEWFGVLHCLSTRAATQLVARKKADARMQALEEELRVARASLATSRADANGLQQLLLVRGALADVGTPAGTPRTVAPRVSLPLASMQTCLMLLGGVLLFAPRQGHLSLDDASDGLSAARVVSYAGVAALFLAAAAQAAGARQRAPFLPPHCTLSPLMSLSPTSL